MDYIYFITIGIFGLVMFLSPLTFMGRIKGKYNEETVKTEKLVKIAGIVIMVLCFVASMYLLLFK